MPWFRAAFGKGRTGGHRTSPTSRYNDAADPPLGSFLTDQRAPVTHAEQYRRHPRIGFDVLVECPDHLRTLVIVAVVDHAAAPERVVGGNEAALAQPRQYSLVVVDVVGFVGIDEVEVEL